MTQAQNKMTIYFQHFYFTFERLLSQSKVNFLNY